MNLIAELNLLAEEWAYFVRIMTIQSVLFIGAILLLMRYSARRDTRVAVWLGWIGLFKLFIPPVIAVPATVPAALTRINAVWYPEITPGHTAATHTLPSTWLMLMCIWSAVVLVLAGKIFFQWLHYRRILKSSIAVAHNGKFTAERYPYQLVRSQFHHSPFICGFRRYQIVLPISSQNWSAAQIDTVVAHELAHIHFGDHRINILQTLSMVLYFFNPLVWLLNFQINRYREIRCDQYAVQQLKIAPSEYAKAILDIAAALSTQNRLPVSVHFSDSFTRLKERITIQLTNVEDLTMKQISVTGKILVVLAMLLFLPFSCNWEEENNNALSTAPEKLKKSPVELGDAVPFYKLTEKPSELKRVAPVYPKSAKENGIEGTVVVALKINEAGTVEDYKVLKSVPELEQAAVDAARQFVFTPAKVKDKPVKVWLTVPFNFKLNN